MVVRKGFRTEIDSYSAFFENDKTTATGLDGYLKSRSVKRVTLAGLALDFCVFYSAMDAQALGYEVVVETEACRAIDLDGSLEAALIAMKNAGIRVK
jgi:nicotinamidase/pyrazinamidase